MAQHASPSSQASLRRPSAGIAIYPIEDPPAAERPEEIESTASAAIEEAEVLHASLKAGSIAQIVVAMIAVVGLLYLLKFVMVTGLAALLLAFILEPLVVQLDRVGIRRGVGALLTVVLIAVLAAGACYFLYSRAKDFATELPKYSERIRSSLGRLLEPISSLESSTRSMVSSAKDGKEPIPVVIQEGPIFPRVIFADGEAIKELSLAIGFIPFLTYFMLTCKQHAHSATVKLFPKEHRVTAYRTVATISAMIRSFLVGNLIVGLISAIVSATVFWLVGIPYFYFLASISGFLSLIPSVGVFMALLPPLVGGIGILDKTGVGVILLTVVGVHAVMMNFVYPKLMGKRLRLNPLAVVLSLLFWAWIWGAMGLVLAVPIIGAAKIVCDYTDSLRGLGAWLGDEDSDIADLGHMAGTMKSPSP
jgi:predicted PurR-regulated permease PerM